MEITDLYTRNYSNHTKLFKFALLATQNFWGKKDSEKIAEDSNRFDEIADCTKKAQFKAILTHF